MEKHDDRIDSPSTSTGTGTVVHPAPSPTSEGSSESSEIRDSGRSIALESRPATDHHRDAAETMPPVHHDTTDTDLSYLPSTSKDSEPSLHIEDQLRDLESKVDTPDRGSSSSLLQETPQPVPHPAAEPDSDVSSQQALKSIGPYLSAAAIDKTSLQASHIPTIAEMKNGHVVELFMYMTKTLKCLQKEVAEKVVQISGQSEVNSHIVSSYISPLITEYKRIKKNKKGQHLATSLATLFDKEFLVVRSRKLRAPDTPKKKKLREDLKSLKKEAKGVKRKLKERESELSAVAPVISEKVALEEQLLEARREETCFRQEYQDLQANLNELQIKYDETICKLERIAATFDPTKDALEAYKRHFQETRRDLEKTEQKLRRVKDQQGSSNVRNLNKKLKRRDATVDKMQKEAIQMQSTVQELKEETDATSSQLRETTRALDKLKDSLEKSSKKKRSTYKRLWSSKRRQSASKVNVDLEGQDDIAALEERIQFLEEKNKELHQLIALVEDPEIETFENGKYSNSIRLTIMELLSSNVSLSKVDTVIRTVLRNLVGKEVSRLPSMGTKSRILVEARHLANVEVVTAMNACRPEDAVGNCIHGDGTTKFHRKYQNFQVTLPDGTSRTMGLSEMAGGDTSAVFESFQERVKELAESISSDDPATTSDITNRMITTIKSTMTDQGPTMPQFSEKIRTLKEELLPHVVSNWDGLTEDDKSTCQQFATFYCKMHPIINFAEEVDKVLKAYEDIAGGGKSTHVLQTAESGARRLVRTSSKAFHHRGCDKSGVEDSFTAYLDNQYDSPNRLVDYIGNRANILFEGAAATYFHIPHIFSFVSMLPDPNNLLQAVAEDSQDRIVEAEVKALGITHQIVTQPLWTAVKTAPNILSLNSTLHELQLKLTTWKEDATPMLAGLSAFANIPAVNDELHDRLFEEERDPEKHAMCIQALELISCAILQILERQCHDNLPGGKFWNPDKATETSFSNVPSTNMIGERDFALLDMLVRQKPSARTSSLEALIMWTNNKTSTWLHNLPQGKQAELLEEARSRAPAMMKKFKERTRDLKKEKWRLLEEKQKKKQQKDQRQVSERANLVEGVMTQGGMWKNKEQIEVELAKMDGEDDETVRRAIFQQLNFYQKVLQVKAPRREMFQLTTTVDGRKKVFNKEEMQIHLIEIVEANNLDSSTNRDKPTTSRTFTDPTERNTNFHDLKGKLFEKMEGEKRKKAIKLSKERLDQLLQHPEQLVGKNVEHKCWNDNKTEAKWYKGIVTKLKKAHVNALKTEFSVCYEGEGGLMDDEEWDFDLLNDLKKNDLIVH
eukprot:XP_011666390.1 PREDICTED: uncharacterized protein LOC105439273 [Strongylocentrotus purpuratus]